MIKKTYFAAYQGNHKGEDLKSRLGVLAIRTGQWTVGDIMPYRITTHCEIVRPSENGQCELFSASMRDGGVREKTITMQPSNWRFYDATNFIRKDYDDWKKSLTEEKPMGYDFWGAIGAAYPWLAREHPDKYFCSELCAEALDLYEPYKWRPSEVEERVHTFCPRVIYEDIFK